MKSAIQLVRATLKPDRSQEAGQVLPLVALFIVVLFGFAALASDVSRAYADLRFYRATADAASLAGAQDLQVVGSRSVTVVEQVAARTHALDSLVQRLGGDATACDPTNPASLDPCVLVGTPYEVTVKTPSPSCSACDPLRSVQVAVRHPDYGLTFARVLGSSEWDVGTTSVSGLVYGKSYTIITLRPPKKLGSTFDVRDITIDGGSIVNVETGDVGSNANMNYSGTNSILTLDPGYSMYFYPAPPPDDVPQWDPPSNPDPPGTPFTTLITDPNYQYPAMRGSLGSATCPSGPANCAPTFPNANPATCGAPGANPACTRADLDPACMLEAQTNVPAAYFFITAQLLNPDTIYCYNPGIYDTSNPNRLTVDTGDLAILKPGAYYFKSGLDVGGRIIGGYQPGASGVALMFDECSNQCIFRGNNAVTIALNAGDKFPAFAPAGNTAATAARDWDNQLVQTSGPSSPTPPLPLTVLVRRDIDGPGGTSACTVPTSPPFVEPAACDANHNLTVNLFGNGDIILEGVQYAPTDNVAIGGNSSSTGRVGQIISWTLKYSGGITINQQGPGTEGNGILRIDAACSAPAEPCNP